MFFSSPSVSSLERYREFGVTLESRYFWLMLLLAALVHGAVIGIYALVPHETVLHVPVRALNMKLKGAGHGFAAPSAPANPVTDVALPAHASALPPPPEVDAQAIFDTSLNSGGGTNEGGKETKKSAAPRAHYGHKSKRLVTSDLPENSNASAPGGPHQYVRAPGEGGGGAEGSEEGSPEGEARKAEAVRRYEQTLSSWMARHKTYPAEAKRQHIEGNAVVRVRINRAGRILYMSIDHTSGNASIDEAVIDMVRASDPAPPVPEHYPAGGEFEFLIPVSFRLQ